MRRLAAIVAVGLLTACASPTPPPGGPETPSPISVTVNPSALPVGDCGHRTDAHFARWSRDPRITVFWLQRDGRPLPEDIMISGYEASPAPADQYPLVIAYDRRGKAIVAARFRPEGWKQRQEG